MMHQRQLIRIACVQLGAGKRLTLANLAEMLGVSYGTLVNWHTRPDGKRFRPMPESRRRHLELLMESRLPDSLRQQAE